MLEFAALKRAHVISFSAQLPPIATSLNQLKLTKGAAGGFAVDLEHQRGPWCCEGLYLLLLLACNEADILVVGCRCCHLPEDKCTWFGCRNCFYKYTWELWNHFKNIFFIY